MAQYKAFADSLDVVIRDTGGNVVERFERTGLESKDRMDAELVRRGYELSRVDVWISEKLRNGGWEHTRLIYK